MNAYVVWNKLAIWNIDYGRSRILLWFWVSEMATNGRYQIQINFFLLIRTLHVCLVTFWHEKMAFPNIINLLIACQSASKMKISRWRFQEMRVSEGSEWMKCKKKGWKQGIQEQDVISTKCMTFISNLFNVMNVIWWFDRCQFSRFCLFIQHNRWEFFQNYVSCLGVWKA